jgi:hypothetical protein
MGLSNRVSTCQSSRELPTESLAVSFEDMIEEDTFQISAAFLCIRHEIDIAFTGFSSLSTSSEFLSECCLKGTFSKKIVWIVISGSSCGNDLSSKDNEISKGHNITVFVIDLLNLGLDQAT